MNGYTSPRRLVVMRHAERVDFTFGENGTWIPSAFDKNGVYKRTNLNMPRCLPTRKGGPQDFQQDSPLTRIGQFQALLTGEALKDSGMKFSYVFSSPAFRCVDTCANVLKAAGLSHLPINVEPGLFEWMSLYKQVLPAWMEEDELKNYGFYVCKDYQPVIPRSSLPSTDETIEELYQRMFFVTKQLLQKYPGNLLIVSHACNLDACTCLLTGKPPRSEEQATGYKIAYAGVVMVEEESDESWRLIDPPFPPLTHTSNETFEWSQLL